MKKKKAFTLIELIAVLVILAILALIVTPLVMNIIKKARISADKRSIDAYGRSIELAIASYLLDEGKFPSSINELTIEYSGDEVICSTTRLNGDSSVYLAKCIVGGRTVSGYTYGKEEVITYDYQVGDEVTYNNVDYYVIKDSSVTEDSLTLLKAEPLTVEEVNLYGGVGTANNHVNMYSTNDSLEYNYQAALYMDGYGAMAYYSSETCGVKRNGSIDVTGCITDYDQSEIKYVVDAWKMAKALGASDARLITKQEIDDNFEIEEVDICGGCGIKKKKISANWMYNSKYCYWTSSSEDSDTLLFVWYVNTTGTLLSNYYINGMSNNQCAVRPVIVLPKSALN